MQAFNGTTGSGVTTAWEFAVNATGTEPTVSDVNKTVNQNTSVNFTTSDFTSHFSDPNAGLSLTMIEVTSLPSHGMLTWNGNAITVPDYFAPSLLSSLAYTPAANYTGSDSFIWTGTDGTYWASNSANVNITVQSPSPQANLTPYQPPGWSDKIVVSNITGTTTDSGTLHTGDTLYVDWAVKNVGSVSTNFNFRNALYVDGIYKDSITMLSLNNNQYGTFLDYPIGSLTAGQHQIEIVVNSGNVISESDYTDNTYTKMITVVPGSSLPNLAIYKLESDYIVVSNTTGTQTDSSPLYMTDNLYVDFASKNIGEAPAIGTFYTTLYVDENPIHQWYSTRMDVGAIGWIVDCNIGSLSAGQHTIKVVTDSTGAIDESDESDNSYTKQITVQSPLVTPPTVNSFTPMPSSVTLGETISLSATASDPDAGDAISAVKFYEGGTLLGGGTFDSSQWTYSWSTAGHAPGTFTISAIAFDSDSTPSEPKTASVTISSADHAPVAADDNYTMMDDDGVLTVPAPGVLANDTDQDGDPLTMVRVSGPSHGCWTFHNGDGSFIYNPQGYVGVDSFTYKANDGTLDSNVATVTVTVKTLKHAPVAVDDSYSMNQDTVLTVPAPGVLANDTDQDGDPLTMVRVSGPSHGCWTFHNGDGSFIYNPQGYVGVDSFTYKANDGTLDSNVATVTVTVKTLKHAPVAVDDSYSMNQDTVLTVPAPGVLANDTDQDGDTLTAVKVINPSHGTLSLNSNGSFTYTPTAGYHGTDGFTYKANDGSLDSNVATVSLTINADTTPPSVTINQGATQCDPTNGSSINFTVLFSEVVADFAIGDVTLGGTAGATTAAVTGSGTTYNVAVSGMTSSGTVIVSVGSGKAHDAAGDPNTASTSTDNIVIYDITAPTVTINRMAGQPIRRTVADRLHGDLQRAGERLCHGRCQFRRQHNAGHAGGHGDRQRRPHDLQRGRQRNDGRGLGDRQPGGGVAQDAAGNLNTALDQHR